MISENKNIENFIYEINKTADAQISQIKADTEKYVRSELSKAKKQAMQEIRATRFSELDKLNEQNNTSFSEAEKKESEMLIKRRMELTDEVFSAVVKKVTDFVSSDEYGNFLAESAKKLNDAIGSAVFYLNPRDEKYFLSLLPYCKEIKKDNTVEIGGIKAVNTDMGIAADDTLDSRISAERQRFYEYSGLSVTL